MLIETTGPKPFQAYRVYKQYTDDRFKVTLIHKLNKSSLFMNYSRYLICIKEGRILNKNEDVDHIDRNQLNDNLSNLQILNESQHAIKTNKERSSIKHGTRQGYEFYKCRCPFCRLAALDHERQTNKNRKLKGLV